MSDEAPFRTILAPLDGSGTGERAVPWAKAVAAGRSSIVLLQVTPVATSVRSIGGKIIGSAEVIQAGYRELAEQSLDEARGRWFSDDDPVRTVVTAGEPDEQILAVATEQNADLIVMSSHGRGAIGRFVSGSVADRVVRQAPVPVMIIGPDGEVTEQPVITRIIAPLDTTELSRRALPFAAALARQVDASVTVVHVIDPSIDAVPIMPGVIGVIPPDAVDLVHEQRESEARALVDQAVHLLNGLGIEAHGIISTGNPAESVMSELRPGDLIVLSSHARAGLARWVLGSTTMKLVRNGRVPVVVINREALAGKSGGHGPDGAA